MGNDICSEAVNYCNPKEPNLVIYEYPSIQEPKEPKAKEIELPELEASVQTVLNKKSEYIIQFIQKECFIKKKYFGDDIFEGELNSNGVPHGIGKMYKSDGSIFIGKFVQGKAQGAGLYILNDGASFQGDLVNNKADCEKGKYINKFFTYEGGFKDNLFSGEGREFSERHNFLGTYENGVKKCGELKWWSIPGEENEYCYYGKFDENGQFTDEGVLKEPTGSYTGFFLKGKKHGEGVYIYNNSLKYEGQYVNGIKQGQGKISFANKEGMIYEGGFKNGLPEGEGFKYDKNGVKVQTFFKQGINVLNLLDPQSF